MSTDDRLAQCANALLATMTLEEKAGQLSHREGDGWTDASAADYGPDRWKRQELKVPAPFEQAG